MAGFTYPSMQLHICASALDAFLLPATPWQMGSKLGGMSSRSHRVMQLQGAGRGKKRKLVSGSKAQWITSGWFRDVNDRMLTGRF